MGRPIWAAEAPINQIGPACVTGACVTGACVTGACVIGPTILRRPFRGSPFRYSAVVGSIVASTWATEFAGKPPMEACSRIASSLDAI